MGLSDRIETFILHLLTDEDEWIELKRNELAAVFDCVPSQINYVLSTRFTQSNGYIIESQRGGGGYLRIKRIKNDDVLHPMILSIGTELDAACAKSILAALYRADMIDDREYKLLSVAVSDNSLTIAQPYKNNIRAQILKNVLSKLKEEVVNNDV